MSKAVIVFPGQGSQYVGMGRELFEKFDSARSVYALADSALGWKISRLCFDGPEEELNLTARTQPSILTTSMAAWRVLEEHLQPQGGLLSQVRYVAGHSLGEYTALVVAGSLRFQDAVTLVEQRGRFMQEAVAENAGAMVAVLGLDRSKVEALCREASQGGVVSPANLNCPGQMVIAGDRQAVHRAAEAAKAQGAKKVIPLAVSVPSHCALMEPACRRLQTVLEPIAFSNLSVPLINNAEARMLSSAEDIRRSLVTQLGAPLLWEDSIRLMLRRGAQIFVEVGPGRVLSGLIRKIDRKVSVLNVEDLDSLNQTVEVLRQSWN